MTAALLNLLQHLPPGLLIAAVLLDAFIVKKNRREVEPAVLWLLFCSVCAYGLLAVVKGAQYLSSGDKSQLTGAMWAAGIAAVAALGWAFKRQGLNLGVLILSERFFGPGPTDPPMPRPGQAFWILGWRITAVAALAAAIGFLAQHGQPAAGGAPVVAAEKSDPSDPSDPSDSSVPSVPSVPSDKPAPAPSTAAVPPPTETPAAEPSPAPPPAVKDPTRDVLPTAEESAAAAQMAAATPAAPATPATPAAAPVVTPPPAPPAEPARPVSRNSAYFSKVRPILARACIKCHGADKQKGDLALHNPDAIRAGINGKPCIVPGEPDKSRLYKCILLPPDDPDFMPQKGQPLSSSDKKTLHDWIKAGADLGDGVTIPGGGGGTMAVDILSTNLPDPDPALVEALTRDHVIVRPLSKNKRVVEIDFSHSDRAYKELRLADLAPIAPNIYKLDLSRTQVKDAELAAIAGMKNLTQLILSRTTVTDAALPHLSSLTALEVINLYSTMITDAGLTHLHSHKSLRKVFLWQSQATAAGAAALTAAVPGVTVSLGAAAPQAMNKP